MSEKGVILIDRKHGHIEDLVFDIVEPGATKITVNSTTNPVSGRFNHAYAMPLSGSIKVYFSDYFEDEEKVGRAFEAVLLLRDLANRAQPVTIGTTRETISDCIISIEDVQDDNAEGIEIVTISYSKITYDIIERRALTIDESLRHSSRSRKDAEKKKRKRRETRKASEKDEEKASTLIKILDAAADKKVFKK